MQRQARLFALRRTFSQFKMNRFVIKFHRNEKALCHCGDRGLRGPFLSGCIHVFWLQYLPKSFSDKSIRGAHGAWSSCAGVRLSAGRAAAAPS